MRGAYGTWPFLQSEGNLGLPFAGIFHRFTHLGGLSQAPLSPALHAARLGHLAVEVCLAVYLASAGGNRLFATVALFGAALALLGGAAIYADAWSYTRVFVWLPLGVWLTGVDLRRRWTLLLLLPAAAWPVVAVALEWAR